MSCDPSVFESLPVHRPATEIVSPKGGITEAAIIHEFASLCSRIISRDQFYKAERERERKIHVGKPAGMVGLMNV